MTDDHPDFDALSAHLDGEAPEWDAHVAGCPACQATLTRLRTVAGMVATPVPTLAASVRDKALARALDAFGGAERPREVTPPAAVVPLPSRAQAPASAPALAPVRARGRGAGPGVWVAITSVAALLLAFVVGAGVLSGGGGGGDDTGTVAAGAPPSQERASSPLGDTSVMSAAAGNGLYAGAPGGVDGGDLGDIAGADGLAAQARTVGGLRVNSEATPSVPKGGNTVTAAGAEADARSQAGPGEPAPSAVGTRPCEMEIRSVRPELGTVVYFATGRVDGTPVVVLGFTAGPDPAAVTLLALAQQEGCRVVLEAAAP